MTATHLHLMLNHIPVLGIVFGLGLMLYALWRKSEELKRAALVVFVIVAILGIPTYLTGEPAEDGVKGLPGVSKPILEKHEDTAGVAFTSLLILGAAGMVSLLWFRSGKAVPGWLNVSLVAMSLVVIGLVFWTANLGGQVRHSEIRPGATAPWGNAGEHHE